MNDEDACRDLAAVVVYLALTDALRDAEARDYVLGTVRDYSPGAFGFWAAACGLNGEVLASQIENPQRLQRLRRRRFSNALRRARTAR